MGMFDFLFDKEKQQAKKLEGLRKKLTNPWSQSPDRYYAANQLFELGTPEAYAILLERFDVQAQNTTYDIEEKQYVSDRMVEIGDPVVDVVKEGVRKSEKQINWLMRILEDVLTFDDMAAFLKEMLGTFDVEYTRDPSKKEQLILRAGSFRDYEDIAKEIARFTVDDNESIRFQSVTEVIKHSTPWAAAAMRENLRLEDSGRVLAITWNYFISNGHYAALEDPNDSSSREFIEEQLSSDYVLSADGHLLLRRP